MKNLKYILGLSLLITLFSSCNSQNDNKNSKEDTFEYSISLDVNNLRGPVILLDRVSNKPVNTVYSRSSEFVIKGSLPVSKMHSSFVLHFPSKYSNPYFYPVSEACAINFKMDKKTEIKAHYDSLLFAKVTNPFMNGIEEFKKKNFPAIAEFDKFNMAGFRKTERRSDKEQRKYAEKGNKLLENLRKEIESKSGLYTKNEEMAVLLGEWGGQLGLKKLDSLKNLLDKSLHTTSAYKSVNAVIDYMKKQSKPKKLEVGQIAPDFKLKDTNGKVHSLSDFKGGFVILDFWASWCGPCKREMPFMKELYKKYKSKGLEMIGVSTDRDKTKWKKALSKLNMPYLQLLDKKGIASSKYFVRGIPYVLLINPKGIIVGIERGEELEKLLAEKLK